MSSYIGIDTSNYRTSVCILTESSYKNIGKLLFVEEGKAGLRQNDALFLHTKALPDIINELPKAESDILRIGVSTRPRDVKGSYMPCFLAGVSAAYSMSYACGAPVFETSHQAGHILAGIYANESGLLNEPEFLALHLSGGTSDILHVKNDFGALSIKRIGGTLDVNAGQLIDRVGVMLGLRFPCGAELEKLCGDMSEIYIKPKISVLGTDFNLSGHQNIAQKMKDDGVTDTDLARYVICAVTETIRKALGAAKADMPVLFIGGVCANMYFKDVMRREFERSYFAPAELSGDNALGCAYGAYLYDMRR